MFVRRTKDNWVVSSIINQKTLKFVVSVAMPMYPSNKTIKRKHYLLLKRLII